MKILVTGANGFIGRNLIAELKNRKYSDILSYDLDGDPGLLDLYTKQCEFVFHLAGVNRPPNPEAFIADNFGFTSTLLGCLRKHCSEAPVVMSSSIQALLANPYGQSKKAAEELLFSYGRETGAKVLVYRLPNVFGKWARPNYNSVVATFCHNVARDLPIQVSDENMAMRLAYIDDVIDEFIGAISGNENRDGEFCSVRVVHSATLGQIARMILSFRQSRNTLELPDMLDPLAKKLYSTYLSYLPKDGFTYPLKMNVDQRGSFTEVIRTSDRGQFSVNVSKPGVLRGHHWHSTKTEKFLVVSGLGLVQLRQTGSNEVLEYHLSGDQLEVLDIPPGYTHCIENLGDTDLVTFMWANETFNPDRPDTHYERVEPDLCGGGIRDGKTEVNDDHRNKT